MRKYTRRKQENEIIEDALNLCRLCLQKPEKSMTIFDGTNTVGSLSLRIMMCVGLELTNESCLSNIICTNCYEELNRCYTFRKKCEVSYQKLKSHLQAIKEKECINKTVIEEETRDNEISPDMSSFLSTLLVQVGVLSQENDMFSFTDNSISDITLTMGNGRTVTFELLEEDVEQIKPIAIEKLKEQPIITEEKQNGVASIELSNEVKTNNEESKNNNQQKDQGVRCGACGKRLSSRGALRRHARVHSGERPHACTLCERRFAQRSVLERHKLVHLERRPFQCPSCCKSFTQRSALSAHARTHEPPHTRALHLHRCPVCNKLFLYPSSLSRHMMMHSGRVFECGACHKQFSDRSSLQRHLKTANHKAGGDNTNPL